MNIYDNLCKKIGSIIPKQYKKERIYPLLEYAGINIDFEYYLGVRILFILILGIISFILPITLFKNIGLTNNFGKITISLAEYSFTLHWLIVSIILSILSISISILIYYAYISHIIQMRAKNVEKFLPDFLFLVSNNINAGMTTFSAVANSTRKEFELLSEEIKQVISKATGQESFTNALKELNHRINSQMLKETISFFSEAMQSGGKLAKLLENTASDLKQRQELKKELKSSTKMYVMFVLFIILIATPLLLAISVQFLKTIEGLQNNGLQNAIQTTQVSFLGGKLLISSEFMKITAYFVLFINSIFAALFMGLLSDFKATQGLKYMPILFIISITLFTLITIFLPHFLNAFK